MLPHTFSVPVQILNAPFLPTKMVLLVCSAYTPSSNNALTLCVMSISMRQQPYGNEGLFHSKPTQVLRFTEGINNYLLGKVVRVTIGSELSPLGTPL